MILLLPLSLFAQNTNSAVLHTNGAGVTVNQGPVPRISALFLNDLIQTQSNALVWIEWTGSVVNIDPDTLLEFEGNELVLYHGRLSATTSQGLRVSVGCVTITPVNDALKTDYDINDVDGIVTVHSQINDVYLDAHSRNLQPAKQPKHSEPEIVRQGDRKSRSEKCAGGEIHSAARAGVPPILDSPWAVGEGAAGIVALACWSLCRGDNPASPTVP